MGGGVFGGLGLGVVVSALVLAVVSLSTPLPERSGAPRPPAVTAPSDPALAPVAPAIDADDLADAGGDEMPAAEAEADAEPVQQDAPPAEAPAAAPAPEPIPAPAPEPEPEAAPEPEAEAEPEAEEAETQAPQAAALAVDTGRPETPGPSDAGAEPRVTLPRIETTPATPGPGAPAQDDATAQSPPSAETAPAPTPEVAARPAQPGPVVVPVAPSPQFIASAETATTGALPRRLALPQASDGPATTDTATAPQPEAPVETAAAAPAPATPRRVTLPQATPVEADAEAETEAPAPRRIVLPQVTQGDADAPAPTPAPALADDPSPEAPAAPNALRDNAVAVDLPADGPLMAVVLIDDPDSPLDPALLTRFTFPVSFAIDPLRPEAAARAAELRAAGFEVVILGGGLIPAGAAPSDVETALAAARETLPQAVALMDTPDSRIQGDRPVLDATVGALAESGHGLLAFPQGLNAAEQSARRAEVPAATFFRLLDDEDQRATVIARFLGRAGFAAGQDGAVVVVGRTRPDTVTGLFSWALGARSEQVTLAPVSAALLRLAE